MEMTFDQYINNPMGKKNSVMSHREMYRGLYKDKLDKILVRENGKIAYNMYNDKDDRYIIHMKIPSETVPNFYYDTVIEFYTNSPTVRLSKSLKKYNVKFYSNDPLFMFTFGYSFIQNKILFEDLVSKVPKEVINTPAKEKNEKNEVGYVKSLYFAYLYMETKGLFDKVLYQSYGQKYTKKAINTDVMHAEEKITLRTEMENEIRKKKKAERIKASNDLRPKIQKFGNTTNMANTSQTITNTKNVSKTTRTSRRTKTTNKVKRK